MSLLIFSFLTVTVLTFLLKMEKYRKITQKWYLNIEELKHKVNLRVAKSIIIFIIIIFDIPSHFKWWLPYLVAVISLRRQFCHLHTYLLAFFCCFYKMHLKFLISHIYLLKQLQTVSIFKARDDGTDMQLRKSWAARNLNQGLHNVI